MSWAYINVIRWETLSIELLRIYIYIISTFPQKHHSFSSRCWEMSLDLKAALWWLGRCNEEGDEIEEREAPGNAAVTYWCYTVLHWDRVHTTRWLINTLFTLWIHYNTDQDLYINKYLPFYSTYSFSFYRNEKSLAHDFTIHYIALWEDQKSEIIKRSIFYVQSITWRKNSETLYIGLL